MSTQICPNCGHPLHLPYPTCAFSHTHAPSRIDPRALFVSPAAEHVFYLTKMDGRTRCDALGIKHKHYVDAKEALEWRNRIAAILDGAPPEHKEEALLALDTMYLGMIRL